MSESGPLWSIYASEHAGIEYLGTSSDASGDVLSVHARHVVPQGVTPYEVSRDCTTIEQGRRSNADGSMSQQLGPSRAIEAMRDATEYEAIRTALGYNVSRIIEHEDTDEVITTVTFSYPSVRLLNRFLDDIDPSAGIRFLEHEGGQYKLLEAAEAFEQGYYLVASEQPYQTHEHGAFHVFGAMGMAGEYLEQNQAFVRAVLTRRKAELDFPSIPGLRSWGFGNDFLQPAHTLARAFGLSLDAVTTGVGSAILQPEVNRQVYGYAGRLRTRYEQIYELKNSIMFDQIPSMLREAPDYQLLERYVYDMQARYDQMEAAADQLVA